MSSPPPKRQKLNSAVEVFGSSTPSDPSSILVVRDLSFQTPLRKKLNVIFTQTSLEAHSPAKSELSLQLKQICQVICIAAPDKAAKTWNFVVLFKQDESIDAWAFGVPDTVAKTAVGGDSFQFDSTESYKSVIFSAFRQLAGVVVVEPSTAEFSSPIPVPGRPKDTAFHVIAHRGAKEGYLYFLSAGILYGFRKPIMFFPLSTIREVTFTNILQRTFNLVVSTEDNVDGEEFGMIDQAVFAGIQGYSVKHGIQDASLSEQRKAKKVGKGNQDMEEGGELEKAVKEYEEEYDDDDEDFRDFDKAETDWEDKDVPKGKGQIKDPGRVKMVRNESQTHKLVANGVDPDTSDDEELDATFEEEDSDEASGSGDSDDDSSESDSDDDSDDDDDDEEEDESSGDEEGDEDEEDEE